MERKIYLIISFIFIPIAVLALAIQYQYYRNLSESTIRDVEKTIKVMANKLERSFDDMLINTRLWSHLPVMREISIGDDQGNIDALFQTLRKEFDGSIKSIRAIDQDGIAFANNGKFNSQKSVINEIWFETVMGGKTHADFLKMNGLPLIRIASGIPTEYDVTEMQGAIEIVFKYDQIEEILKKLHNEWDEGQHYLGLEVGGLTVINLMSNAWTGPSFEISKLLTQDEQTKNLNLILYKVPVTISVDGVDLQWSIVAGIDKDYKFKSINTTILVMAFIMFLITMIIVLVAPMLIRKNILFPIKELVDATVSISKGQYNISASEEQRDELGQLAKAFNKMSKTIRWNTDTINKHSKSIQALLNGLPIGVLTVDSLGMVSSEYSKITESILESDEIASLPFEEVILKHANISNEQKSMLLSSINACFGEDEIVYNLNEDKFVSSFSLTINGQVKYIDCSWSYVTDENCHIVKFIVTLKDVTIIRELEEVSKNKSKELEIIGHLLSSDGPQISSFIGKIYDELDEISQIKIYQNNEGLSSLLRRLHTIKGNARIYQMSYLSELIHDTETQLIEKSSINTKNIDTIFTTELGCIKEVVDQYYSAASRIGIVNNDRQNKKKISLHLDSSLIDYVNHLYCTLTKHSIAKEEDKVIQIINLINHSRSITVKESLHLTVSSLGGLAKRLEKETPSVVFNRGDDFKIFREYGETLNDAFGHLFRNSLDHGIESPSTRNQRGKKPQGTITIGIRSQGQSIELSYGDDGKGLDINRIKQKAVSSGIIGKTENDIQKIVNTIFSSRFSTKEISSDISGRGVGLDAVRNLLTDVKGSISINLLEEVRKDGFVKFEYIISLPREAFFFPLMKKEIRIVNS